MYCWIWVILFSIFGFFWGGGKGGRRGGVSLRTLPVSHHCGRGYLCHMLRYCSVSFTFFLQNVCSFLYLGVRLPLGGFGCWQGAGQGIGQGMAGHRAGHGRAKRRFFFLFFFSSSLFLFPGGFLSRRRRGFFFFVWVGSFPFFVSLYRKKKSRGE